MSKDPSSSNTPAESSTPASALSGADLDRLLNREASAIQRELEVERILNAFKLKSVSLLFSSWALSRLLTSYRHTCSPYDILDLEPSATADDIKKKYRQLSLCELPLSTRNLELCSLMRGFLYVFND
jgi:DnaJ family protein C protein 8